jgi:hypothetical protein
MRRKSLIEDMVARERVGGEGLLGWEKGKEETLAREWLPAEVHKIGAALMVHG